MCLFPVSLQSDTFYLSFIVSQLSEKLNRGRQQVFAFVPLSESKAQDPWSSISSRYRKKAFKSQKKKTVAAYLNS